MPKYKAITVEDLQTQKSRRGGARPGAGRKRGSGSGFVDKIQVCVTPQQRQRFERLGSAKWLRGLLDEQNISAKLASKKVAAQPADADPGATPATGSVQDASAPAGVLKWYAGGSSGEGNEPATVSISEYLLDGAPASLIAYDAGTDDMRAAGIARGDLLLVDTAKTPADNDIVLIDRKGWFMPRRFSYRRYRSIQLQTERGRYRDTFIDLNRDAEFQMVGVIVGVVRKVVNPKVPEGMAAPLEAGGPQQPAGQKQDS